MAIRTPLSRADLETYLREIEPLKRGFDLLRDHVVITDANANILYANKTVEERTGFPISEIIGKNPGDLWGGEMPQAFYENMWRTIKETKEPFVGEVKNTRKDGTHYWQELHIAPILDQEGNVRFFIGVEPDITDRKEQEAFRAEFISIVGHQLKNPLTATKWLLDWLRLRGKLDPKDREILDEVYRKNQDLIYFVTDLLAASRLQGAVSGKEPLRLEEEITKIIAEVQKAHPTVHISFEQPSEPAVITVERQLALIVFFNVISNAAEYCDPGNGRVEVRLVRNDEGFLFSCENNGLVILPDERDKIFTRVYRTKSAEARKSSGSGIGLYLVKLITDHFGWKIWFESPPPGKETGVVFRIVIPTRHPMQEGRARELAARHG
ncbi:PAS domain S-box protein [Candidatus Parcubacteria bacterium]|nr:MAG: PAS domain S-box protein [Candidatus Parcubacteria bacterium]